MLIEPGCISIHVTVAPTYIYSYKDIRFETLSNVERMVIDERPSSLSSLAVIQMDDGPYI